MNLEEKVLELEERIQQLEKEYNPKYRVCPECGKDLVANTMVVLACYPPKYTIRCSNYPECKYYDIINESQLPFIKYREKVDGGFY